MKLVKNDMVNMQWDADGYVETKSRGFISAVHQYDGANGKVAVAFRDGKIYTCIDEDGDVIGFTDLVKEIKQAVKDKDSSYPAFYDDYAELFDGEEFAESTLNYLGIADEKQDMLDRLEDLGGYWGVVETPM